MQWQLKAKVDEPNHCYSEEWIVDPNDDGQIAWSLVFQLYYQTGELYWWINDGPLSEDDDVANLLVGYRKLAIPVIIPKLNQMLELIWNERMSKISQFKTIGVPDAQ